MGEPEYLQTDDGAAIKRQRPGSADLEALNERREAAGFSPLPQLNGPPRRVRLGTVVSFVPPPASTERNHSKPGPEAAGLLPEQLASCSPTTPPSCIQAPPPDRSRSDWRPVRPFEPAPYRRRMYRLRDGLRCISRPRIRACGYAAIAPRVKGGEREATDGSVGVIVDGHGTARLTGLAHCGSIWECPVCQCAIKAQRSREVEHAVEAHGRKRVAMLSLTVRHGIGDDLKHAREVVSNAWRAFCRGGAFERFKQRIGLWGTIRSLEVTHGSNGWHPHLHVLLLCKHELPREQLIEVTDDDGSEHWRWTPPELGWLIDRWRSKVADLAPELAPDDQHGCQLSPVSVSGERNTDGAAANYITKLGLEMSDPGIKRGRHLNRSPLQIANDFVELGSKRDAALWQEYCRGMKGAKFLTWSRGLKRAFGIDERTDQEIALHEEEPAERVQVGRIECYAWQAIRDMVVDTATAANCDGSIEDVGMVSAAYWICEQCERGGKRALDWALLAVACGEVGRNNRRTAAHSS
jgi:hypothetical protein